MRLIDADLFEKEIKAVAQGQATSLMPDMVELSVETIVETLDEVPTAYDIEHKCKDCAGCTLCKCDEANAIQEYINKIVEQLEEEEEESYADFERYAEERGLDEYNDFYSVGMKRAIEIVKGGGMND